MSGSQEVADPHLVLPEFKHLAEAVQVIQARVSRIDTILARVRLNMETLRSKKPESSEEEVHVEM